MRNPDTYPVRPAPDDTEPVPERDAIDTFCALVLGAFVLALAWLIAGDWARALVLP